MITEEKVERINELARKAKTSEGLSEEEKEEQQVLRREYIDSFKANLRSQLEQIEFVEDVEEAEGRKKGDHVVEIEENLNYLLEKSRILQIPLFLCFMIEGRGKVGLL